MQAKSFDKYLSKQLQDIEYRRDYLLQLMKTIDDEKGLSLFDALKDIINIIGVTEFANLAGIESSVISQILSQKELPTIKVLDRLLSPFHLKTKIDVEAIAS